MAEPFVGLRPFEEADWALFYGREADIRLVAANLRTARLTLMYGESGVGKSSLINAGVIHRLREQAAPTTAEGLSYRIACVDSWKDDPVATVVTAIERASGNTAAHTEAGTRPSLKEAVNPFRRTREVGERPVERRLLLVFDQFEQYFQYQWVKQPRHGFVADLASIIDDPDLSVNILISIREDMLAALDVFLDALPGLYDNCYRLRNLDAKDARNAIVMPIERYNTERHPDLPKVTFDPDLPSAVIASIGETTGGESDIPATYLQLVMHSLWKADIGRLHRKLRTSTLTDKLKSARHIYERHFTDTVREVTKGANPDVLAKLFEHLVTATGRRQTFTVQELQGATKLDNEVVRTIVVNLDTARILRTLPAPSGSSPGSSAYEFAHDILAKAALEWRLEHEREREQDAEELKRRNEVRVMEVRLRKQRNRFRVSTTIAAVFILLVLFAGYQWRRALNAVRGTEVMRLQSAAGLTRANAADEANPVEAARLRLEAAQLEERANRQRNGLSADDRFAVDQCRAFETNAGLSRPTPRRFRIG